MEIPFSVGKVYAGNDVRNFLGTGLGKGDYSSKRVKADSARTHLLPRSSSCIHVRARARLHVPIYTPTNRETGGGEWKRVQRTRPARIAIDRQLFLVSSYRCTYGAPAASLCGYLERNAQPKLHVGSHVYGVRVFAYVA